MKVSRLIGRKVAPRPRQGGRRLTGLRSARSARRTRLNWNAPHAARIGTDGQDLPRRRGLRHPRADRSRGAIRLGEGKDRGPGATRRDPPAAALRSLSAKRWP
jgi:hypothetical protein